MSVRAKFKCESVKDFGGSKEIAKDAVGHDGENATWSPSGKLTMHITNPDAFNQFEPGKCDFSPVE